MTTSIGNRHDVANALVVQPDGKLVAAGYASTSGLALVRYNADGTLDGTFGTGGTVTTRIRNVHRAAPMRWSCSRMGSSWRGAGAATTRPHLVDRRH